MTQSLEGIFKHSTRNAVFKARKRKTKCLVKWHLHEQWLRPINFYRTLAVFSFTHIKVEYKTVFLNMK